MVRSRFSRLLILASYACLPILGFAQEASVLTEEAYLRPPKAIEDILLAPKHEQVTLSNLSPDRTRFLRSVNDGIPGIDLVGKHYLNLGGEMIDPVGNRDRALNYRSGVGYSIFDWRNGRWLTIDVPDNSRVSGAEWSPDGKSIAYFAHQPNGSYIFIADANSGRSRRVTSRPALLTLATNLEWVNGGKNLVSVMVPIDRGPKPEASPYPNQPIVRYTEGVENRQRTYRTLLEDLHSQSLLEYYITGQLAIIDAGNGSVKNVGKPAMIRSFSASPDGKFFRVTTTLKPFSYIVPAGSFGSLEEIWDGSGTVVAELNKRELRFGPGGGGGGGNDKRSLTWRPDGQGLSFLQIEPAPARGGGNRDDDGAPDEQRGGRGGGAQGDQPLPQGRKDRVMQWLPPFGEDDTKVVYESDSRIGSVRYSPDMQTLFLTETRSGTETMYAVNLSDPKTKKTIYTNRTEDFYKTPGNLMMTSNELGQSVVRMSADSGTVYLYGTQYFQDPITNAPRPFLDSVEIASGTTKRLWESSPSLYETVSTVLDERGVQNVVISRESKTTPPNQYLVNLDTKEEKILTNNIDLLPEVTRAQRYRVQVTRPDGFKFWVAVTTPPDHQKGNKLPAMFWFYPREFADQAAYDRTQRTFNKNDYISMSNMSMEYLTVLGYAVIQPDAPIVGPTGRMNDRYVHDLRNNLAAVIDELDRQGIIDRTRLAVGGHSYGAFSAANAMVHTPFFKAGIAGDGAYNRTLTPMAFQSERRLLWEARETYLSMSPMLYADQLTGALLMYHGIDDQNVGTHPINSIRMFHALQGLGKTASLYMYPAEDHGPAARETFLDLWARWVAWLDKYVKNGT